METHSLHDMIKNLAQLCPPKKHLQWYKNWSSVLKEMVERNQI
jgi:hypothetical protein